MQLTLNPVFFKEMPEGGAIMTFRLLLETETGNHVKSFLERNHRGSEGLTVEARIAQKGTSLHQDKATWQGQAQGQPLPGKRPCFQEAAHMDELMNFHVVPIYMNITVCMHVHKYIYVCISVCTELCTCVHVCICVHQHACVATYQRQTHLLVCDGTTGV